MASELSPEDREFNASLAGWMMALVTMIQLVVLFMKAYGEFNVSWFRILSPAWMTGSLVVSIFVGDRLYRVIRDPGEGKPEAFEELFDSTPQHVANPNDVPARYPGWHWGQTWTKDGWDIAYNPTKGEWRAVHFAGGWMEHHATPGDAMAWADQVDRAVAKPLRDPRFGELDFGLPKKGAR